MFHLLRFRRLSVKLGYSIGFQTLGYGVVLHHHGTIVVGMSNRLGNYTVLHTSTCIADMNITIGNALYLGTGAKIISHVSIGDNVSIGANSVVNDSFESNSLVVGIPAKKIRDESGWYEKKDKVFRWRIDQIEKLKKKLNYQSNR